MLTQARAAYRVGIEDIEPGHWVTFAFDLPGCFSAGPSREASLAGAPAAIREHLAWLTRHGGMVPTAGAPIQLEAVEEFRSFVGEGDYIINACFADDRRPLTGGEVDQGLWLLDCTRHDLLGALGDAAGIACPEEVRTTLAHIAGAEWWYLDRLGLAPPREALHADVMARLDLVRSHLRRRLPELVGDDTVVTRSGEQWSARKVLRRALWHERDHTCQIAALLDAPAGQ